jgi:hypothetical protein
MLRKDMILIPFIGTGGYSIYRVILYSCKQLLTSGEDKYRKIFKDILNDFNIDEESFLNGDYIPTKEELTKLINVYKARTNGRDIMEDIVRK